MCLFLSGDKIILCALLKGWCCCDDCESHILRRGFQTRAAAKAGVCFWAAALTCSHTEHPDWPKPAKFLSWVKTLLSFLKSVQRLKDSLSLWENARWKWETGRTFGKFIIAMKIRENLWNIYNLNFISYKSLMIILFYASQFNNLL